MNDLLFPLLGIAAGGFFIAFKPHEARRLADWLMRRMETLFANITDWVLRIAEWPVKKIFGD
jgi:hypothetical protein